MSRGFGEMRKVFGEFAENVTKKWPWFSDGSPVPDDSYFAPVLEEWEYEAALLGTTVDGLHTAWALGASDVPNKTSKGA